MLLLSSLSNNLCSKKCAIPSGNDFIFLLPVGMNSLFNNDVLLDKVILGNDCSGAGTWEKEKTIKN